jgi:hypothetical protein
MSASDCIERIACFVGNISATERAATTTPTFLLKSKAGHGAHRV